MADFQSFLDNFFDLDEISGQLFSSTMFDRENRSDFSLVIKASRLVTRKRREAESAPVSLQQRLRQLNFNQWGDGCSAFASSEDDLSLLVDEFLEEREVERYKRQASHSMDITTVKVRGGNNELVS